MAENEPSPFLGGLRLLLSNKRTLLWSYLALLAIGLISGASLHARVGPFLDHSLAAQRLAGGIDVASFGELFAHVNEHDPGAGPVTASLALLSVLFSFLLAAGMIFVFLSGEKPRLATLLSAGAEYFWRFFRLMLFAAIISGILLGLLGWLRTLYLEHADKTYVEAAYDIRFLITLAILLLVALVLRLWFDLAEVLVVRFGREGNRRVRETLVPSWRLLREHFGRIFLGYFAAGTLGIFGFVVFSWIWAAGQTSHLVLLIFLFSQLGLLCLLASRIWQRGIVTAVVLANTEATQTVIYVQPGPPEASLYPTSISKEEESDPLPSAAAPGELIE